MSLLNDVIVGSYDYPTSSSVYGPFSYSVNPFVVNGTVETVLTVDGSFTTDVNFSANSLVLTLTTARSESPDPFNGPVFQVLSGSPFTSVIGVQSSDPIPDAPVSAYVSGGILYVNWEGGGGNIGDTITIDFAPAPPAPVMLDAVNAAHHLTTLAGTAEANSNVSVFDGTKLIGTATATSDGTWSLQTKLTGNGVHSFTESSTDIAGNTTSSVGVTLYASTGDKLLQGGSGNDVLIGAQGDKLTGGAGADTFVFNPKFGKEIITNFNVNLDVLAFDHSLFANATSSQVLSQTHDSKAGAVIVVDAHDTVTLTGVSVPQLQSHLNDIHFF